MTIFCRVPTEWDFLGRCEQMLRFPLNHKPHQNPNTKYLCYVLVLCLDQAYMHACAPP